MQTMIGWLRRRRRAQVQQQETPARWIEILEKQVFHFAYLSSAERSRLIGIMKVLIAEKNWEGCAGLEISDEIQVIIASQIALLALELEQPYFDSLLSILVYPTGYLAPDQWVLESGVVLEGHSDRAGEAWYRGPVVISWADARAGARSPNAGHNVVLHEFAHQLDMQNGSRSDGIPPLASIEQAQRWQRVMRDEFQRLQQHCQEGRNTVLDCYGATDSAEFFAVATEHFFQTPRRVAGQLPMLYDLLRDYYRQDPAKRAGGPPPAGSDHATS
jgi:Mlc titration factor MtfA (ptsG expression regulator)